MLKLVFKFNSKSKVACVPFTLAHREFVLELLARDWQVVAFLDAADLLRSDGSVLLRLFFLLLQYPIQPVVDIVSAGHSPFVVSLDALNCGEISEALLGELQNRPLDLLDAR